MTAELRVLRLLQPDTEDVSHAISSIISQTSDASGSPPKGPGHVLITKPVESGPDSGTTRRWGWALGISQRVFLTGFGERKE